MILKEFFGRELIKFCEIHNIPIKDGKVSILEQIILRLLNDYPDKKIAVKHIVQLFKGQVEIKNED